MKTKAKNGGHSPALALVELYAKARGRDVVVRSKGRRTPLELDDTPTGRETPRAKRRK